MGAESQSKMKPWVLQRWDLGWVLITPVVPGSAPTIVRSQVLMVAPLHQHFTGPSREVQDIIPAVLLTSGKSAADANADPERLCGGDWLTLVEDG